MQKNHLYAVGSGARIDVAAPPPAAVLSPSEVERLFREHNETLLRFLRARLGSDAEAEEAAQEAYVRLLQLNQPEQPSFLRAYLFRIAANLATDLNRRRGLAFRSRADTQDEVEPHQERALCARQQLDLVSCVLNQLPPKCREAFIRHRHEGQSTVEIAAALKVSDRMVRLYLARALEHLEAALDREPSAPGRGAAESRRR